MNRDNPQETATAIGYLAGILDGEGSITLSTCERKQRKWRTLGVTPKVVLTNTDPGIIEQCVKCLEMLGVAKHVRHTSARNRENWNCAKDVHFIEIFGNSRVSNLLKKIAPALGGQKRQRAEVLMNFIDRRMAKAEFKGKTVNYKYDQEDVNNILAFFELTASKRIDHYRRLLNDYTQDRLQVA